MGPPSCPPTQLQASILAADIATAGTVPVTVLNPDSGLSNAVNFRVWDPPPAIISLSPSYATAGGAAFTLTVSGANFVSGAKVRWNGTDRGTTFVSADPAAGQHPGGGHRDGGNGPRDGAQPRREPLQHDDLRGTGWWKPAADGRKRHRGDDGGDAGHRQRDFQRHGRRRSRCLDGCDRQPAGERHGGPERKRHGDVYAQLPAFTGVDTFTYTVADAQGAVSNQATVTVTVNAVSAETVIDNGGPGTSSTGTWAVSGATGSYGSPSVWSRDGSEVHLDLHPVAFRELRTVHVVDRLFEQEHERAGGYQALRRDDAGHHQPAAERREMERPGEVFPSRGRATRSPLPPSPGRRAPARMRSSSRFWAEVETCRRPP